MSSNFLQKLNNGLRYAVKSVDKAFFNTDLTCNLCEKENFNGKAFCDDCERILAYNSGIVCETCGRKVFNWTERCISCKDVWAVDKARSVFVYSGEVESLIKKYKYSAEKYLADIFAEKMKDVLIKNMLYADFVTCVPMTADAVFERGFNQSEYLAKKIASLADLHYENLLYKKKETPHQAGLKRAERQKNLKGSFGCDCSAEIIGKSVLLIDDVLTTGSTSNEIAEVLKKKGAKEVFLLTIASTPTLV